MDNIDSRKSYSDLEAIVTTSAAPGHQSYWNAKFAIPSTSEPIHKTTDGADAPEAVPSQFISSSEDKSAVDAKSFFDSSPVDTVAPAPPAYFLVDSKGQAQALYTVPSKTASDTSSIVNFKGGISPAPPSAGGWWKSLGEGKRICGLRKNVCLAVLAGVCMLVLGLLLTVLLLTHPPGKHGSKSSNMDDDDAPKFSTLEMLKKGDVGPFLAASSLAAMNWTVAGKPFIGVFYQSSAATGSGLMVAIKNETSQQWSSVNISASASSPSVLPGTPLAAASNNGLWNLYYLTESMTVAEIYSTDPTSASGWLQGDFAAKMGSPAVFPGSGLGAMWQLCDNCNDALFVSWQNAQDGTLAFANMTNMTWGGAVVLDSNAADGSPVTINAFTDTGKSVGGDHNAVRFYFTEDDSLMEVIKGPLGSGQLIAGNNGAAITRGLSKQPPPKLASLTYGTGQGEGGWNNNLLAWIDPRKGSLQAANFINAGQWYIDAPKLDGNPQKVDGDGFSAIAMTQNMKIYLLHPKTEEIHEYSTNSTTALGWVWQETVNV